MRLQVGWESYEDYSTATYALPVATAAALDHIATLGLDVLLTAAYGPPYQTIETMTLAADAPIGSTALVFTADPVNTSADRTCFINKVGLGGFITEPHSYPGSLIHAVDHAAFTVTLAAETAVALTAGDSLDIRKLKYPPMSSADPADASNVAWNNYVRALAAELSSRGITGSIELWNEPYWPNDLWDNLFNLYSSTLRPVGVVDIGHNPKRDAVLVNGALPAGVTLTLGATHKSGWTAGLDTLDPADVAILPRLAVHPYGNHPETHTWWPGSGPDGVGYLTTDALWSNSNWRSLAKSLDDYRATHGVAPDIIVSEVGISTASDEIQARHQLRQFFSWLGMGATRFHFFTMGATEDYDWLNGDGSRRQVADAMARVGSFTDRLIDTAGTSEPPTLTTDPADFEVWTLGIQGAGRSAAVAWQRTVAATVGGWSSLPSPAPVDIGIVTSGAIVGAWNLRTGNVVTVVDNVVPVADDPIWIEVG